MPKSLAMLPSVDTYGDGDLPDINGKVAMLHEATLNWSQEKIAYFLESLGNNTIQSEIR